MRADAPLLPPAELQDDAAQTERTREVVTRYHLCWKRGDLEAVLALYHPDIEYNDFFQQRTLRHAELRQYVEATQPRLPGELLEHIDRIRVDGHSAFIQYRNRVLGGEGMVAFRTSEVITVHEDLIWRVNEYATLVREGRSAPGARDGEGEGEGQGPGSAERPALSRLGLSARQLALLAQDLQVYFRRHKPFLDPNLNLQQVAAATGYTRNQVSHLLNQVLGLSFYRYVNQARLQHLLHGLEPGGDLSRIDELAFAAGFNSLSTFYSCFRRHTGQSPKAYLKERSARVRMQDDD